MSFTLGNLPKRVQGFHGDPLDNFGVARGRAATGVVAHASCCGGVAAGKMTALPISMCSALREYVNDHYAREDQRHSNDCCSVEALFEDNPCNDRRQDDPCAGP